MKRKYPDRYIKVMKQIDLSEDAKKRICRTCALHSTLHQIKNGRYAVNAQAQKKTSDS